MPSAPPKPEKQHSFARRVLRWLLLAFLAALAVLVAGLMVKTLSFKSKQPLVQRVEVAVPPAADLARRLAASLRLETISGEDHRVASQAFDDLHEHLRVSFPLVHEQLVRESVGRYSLLYTWRGSEPALPGLILAAHMDVVPADPARWSHPPFSGLEKDEYLYGRGALDDKVGVLGTLEAVEQLLREDYAPRRSIYLAFGHDEEIGGYDGARAIAALLEERGVRAEATIDEGLVITEGILDGIDRPVALIGVAEKGFVNVELVARGEGGHSSMPPRTTAVGVLSKAIVTLQANPMPGSISGPVRDMFAYVGPELGFARRLVMANLWLFGGLVMRSLDDEPATDALLRTTTAPTMLSGSPKSNVLPQEARAVVNFRIKPGDTSEDVLRHVRRVIADERVSVSSLEAVEPQRSSSVDSRIFDIMHRSIRSLDPTIVVAPGLMIALTDSRHYSDISENTYRFSAVRLGPDDLKRVHGVDERIRVDNYAEVVAFNILLIRAAAE